MGMWGLGHFTTLLRGYVNTGGLNVNYAAVVLDFVVATNVKFPMTQVMLSL